MNRFYRLLLRLYPRSYRAEYASELERTFAESNEGRGAPALAFAALADVVPNALAVHWRLLLEDLRYTARSLNRARGFAIAMVLVTALGVGANAATFSVADFVLIRPLAFPKSDELVRVCEGTRARIGWGCMNQMSPAVYRDVLTSATSFRALGVYTTTSFNLVGSDEPVRVAAAATTPNVLALLGITPIVGRAFDTLDLAIDAQSVVIGYGLWQSQFGGDPRIVGRKISLDGSPRVVIGVMPAHFIFPSEDTQVWVTQTFAASDYEDRGNTYLDGIGRLASGVKFETARAELLRIGTRLERDHPADHPDMGFSFFRLRDQLSPTSRLTIVVLCGASLCMLLLTCANLANLSLARAAGRGREMAVLTALGAGRERLVRQMLTESIVLALVGGIAGGLFAAFTLPLLTQLVPSSLPIATAPKIDLRVFAFAASFATLTGLGFGVIPAMRASRPKNFLALREGSRGTGRRQRLRGMLVSLEVAMSVALLVSSGLLLRAMQRVSAVETGFDSKGVIAANTQLPSPRYDSSQARAAFYRRVLTDVRSIPGVQSAGYTSGLPFLLTGGISTVLLPGEVDRHDGNQNASYRLVSSGYLESLQIPLREGRLVSETDTREQPRVAVISQSFATRHWPGRSALGMTFSTRGQSHTVVGVVGDVRVRGLERQSEPQLYVPFDQAPANIGPLYIPKVIVVRSNLADASVAATVRRIVQQADPQQPVSNVQLLSTIVANQTGTRSAQVRILGALAALAIVLAGVGIYGLLAYTVAQRDREIGVRLALGAKPSAIAAMILGEGVRLSVFGVVPGIVIAWAAGRAMSSLLFGVPPQDPLVLTMASVLCVTMTLLACALPAVRAARISPLAAMRAE
jgi:predicted permease